MQAIRRRVRSGSAGALSGVLAVMEAQGRRHDWLALHLGVPRPTLSHWLRGSRPISADAKARIARLLGVPEEMLFRAPQLSERCEKCRSGKDEDEEGAA